MDNLNTLCPAGAANQCSWIQLIAVPPPLYRSLYGRLIKLLPLECDSHVINMVYLMMGISLAKKVQTWVIVCKVPLG